MLSVGAYLRDLRQRRGVSLEEIARTTRVAQRYLEAIETEAFDTLPAPVFIRGFIRAYCQALGEPPEEALAVYDGRETRAVPSAAHPVPPRGTTDSEPRARGAVLVSFVLLVVLGMALFTVALLIHPRERAERVAVEVRPEPRPETRPVPPPVDMSRPIPVTPAPRATAATPPATAPPSTTPPASGVPSAPPSAPPSTTPPASRVPSAPPPATTPPPVAAVTPSAPASPPAAAPVPPATPAAVPPPNLEGFSEATSPYRLVARTNETTWIRVRTEDGRMSEENVPPGEVREWISNRPFVLTIGNAGGVAFELNGRPLPALGAKGAVIQRLVLPPESR